MTIYDVGTYDGVPYQVCELLEGRTLRRVPARAVASREVARLRGPVRPVALARRTARESCTVISSGETSSSPRRPPEDHRLRNRQLVGNPAVVPPRQGGSPNPVALQTLSGTVMGTVAYMAARTGARQARDHHADIFAFGAILTRESPAGARSPAIAVRDANAILRRRLAALPSETAPELEAIVRCCLRKRRSTGSGRRGRPRFP